MAHILNPSFWTLLNVEQADTASIWHPPYSSQTGLVFTSTNNKHPPQWGLQARKANPSVMNQRNVSRRCHCCCMIATTCSLQGIDAHRPISRPVHPFVLCSDVTNYSCWNIRNVSSDQWTVIAQLSTTHEEVSEDYITTEDIFDCCENIMKKSLFARTVTSPRVPTVIWFQPWLTLDTPRESWIVGIVCVVNVLFCSPFKAGISTFPGFLGVLSLCSDRKVSWLLLYEHPNVMNQREIDFMFLKLLHPDAFLSLDIWSSLWTFSLNTIFILYCKFGMA